MKRKVHGCYLLYNFSVSKWYVGQSINIYYRSRASAKYYHAKIIRLFPCPVKLLDTLEIWLIRFYKANGPSGYNRTKGGKRRVFPGWKWPPELKLQQSLLLKQRWKTMSLEERRIQGTKRNNTFWKSKTPEERTRIAKKGFHTRLKNGVPLPTKTPQVQSQNAKNGWITRKRRYGPGGGNRPKHPNPSPLPQSRP